MTREMYDALNPAGIPTNIPANALVASYVDHPEYPFHLVQDRFPNHRCVTISAHGHMAQIFDVENGAMTPGNVPHLVTQARTTGGIEPWVYATASNWALTVAACNAAKVKPPLWWAAHWTDDKQPAPIPDGAIGRQYANVQGAGINYDISLVADYIPGFDQPTPPAPTGDDFDMTPQQVQEIVMESLALFFAPGPQNDPTTHQPIPHSGEGWGREIQEDESVPVINAIANAVVAKLPK